MSNLKPIPPFTHKNALYSPSIPPLPKAKKNKKQFVIFSLQENEKSQFAVGY